MDGHNLDGFWIAGVLYDLTYLAILTIAITAAIGSIALVANFSGRLLAATWKWLTRTRELK